LKRSGFKPRKESMRVAYARKIAAKGFKDKSAPKPRSTLKRPTGPAPARKAALKRTTLKKQSKGREREMRQYYQERNEWLLLPQNAACAVCLCLGETPRAATEVHHQRGRIGRLLRDQRFWIPTCRQCREIPHERPAWAREMGLLSASKDWNVFPR